MKAFTLIEMLVVIAIVGILAALLFPVLSQAKADAKRTVSISNQKQIGMAMLAYVADSNDLYPRHDGCTLNDSLNPKFNSQPAGTDPMAFCTGSGPTHSYAFRDNRYNWQKWLMPYAKSAGVFVDPVTRYDQYSYDALGEIQGGYALNVALTGAIDSIGPQGYLQPEAVRTSWLGGSPSSVPYPSDAMIFMQGPFASVIPAMNLSRGKSSTSYPLALREHWTGWFYSGGGTGACGASSVLSPTTAPYGGHVPLGFCDGHAAAVRVDEFLAKTPASADYYPSNPQCGGYPTERGGLVSNVKIATPPEWTKPWPLWGLAR